MKDGKKMMFCIDPDRLLMIDKKNEVIHTVYLDANDDDPLGRSNDADRPL